MLPEDKEIERNKRIISTDACRKAMKHHTNLRIGRRAVYASVYAVEGFVEAMSVLAKKSLDDENKRKENEGLPARKTIQEKDIFSALRLFLGDERGGTGYG